MTSAMVDLVEMRNDRKFNLKAFNDIQLYIKWEDVPFKFRSLRMSVNEDESGEAHRQETDSLSFYLSLCLRKGFAHQRYRGQRVYGKRAEAISAIHGDKADARVGTRASALALSWFARIVI